MLFHSQEKKDTSMEKIQSLIFPMPMPHWISGLLDSVMQEFGPFLEDVILVWTNIFHTSKVNL